MAGVEKALEITKEEDFLIIPGIEISSKDGHILGLNIEKRIPSNLSASETVNKIRNEGGVAVSAHPFGLGWKPFSVLKADFDAVEVFNPRRYLGNKLARKYVSEHNLPVTAGSDAHFCEEIGLAGVEVDCDLQVDKVLKK